MAMRKNRYLVVTLFQFVLSIVLLQTCQANQQRQLLGKLYMSSSLTANKTGVGSIRLSQSNEVVTNGADSFVRVENKGVGIAKEDIKTSTYNHLVNFMNRDRGDSGICNDLSIDVEETAVVIAKAIGSAYLKSKIYAEAKYAMVKSRIEGLAAALARAIVDITINVILMSFNYNSAAQAILSFETEVRNLETAIARVITEVELESKNGILLSAEAMDTVFSQEIAQALASIMYEAFTKLYGCDDPDADIYIQFAYEGELGSKRLDETTSAILLRAPPPPPPPVPVPVPSPIPSPIPSPVPSPIPSPKVKETEAVVVDEKSIPVGKSSAKKEKKHIEAEVVGYEEITIGEKKTIIETTPAKPSPKPKPTPRPKPSPKTSKAWALDESQLTPEQVRELRQKEREQKQAERAALKQQKLQEKRQKIAQRASH
eukprot:TRINITY_DN12706_c0_g4_i4.p1 TRINITY_DN12706_c0_g4~~TRINITY_DN12706_c0_g4_i4.p1  ORF type:complete len:429 (+),score=45.33 TRINITY_DN12706_c0_g4_i4:198-1484(+)